MNNDSNLSEIKSSTIDNLMKFWVLFLKNTKVFSKEDGNSLKMFAQSVEFYVDHQQYNRALQESQDLVNHTLNLIKQNNESS